MVTQVAAAIPDSYTIVDQSHPFYDDAFDRILSRSSGRFGIVKRVLWGPILFGTVLARAHGVIYVGNLGFLITDLDERAWEFAFVRARDRHVVVIFTGNDIRSPALMTELAKRTGFDNLGAVLARQGAPYNTHEYEEQRRRRSKVADEHASAIFTARVDQMSYITRETHAFPYLYPDERLIDAREKFSMLGRIRFLHAPSRPELKGTECIRAAIHRVQRSHPEVEYVELTNVTNDEVREEMRRAHVVINQLHSYVPGVFGIEAMSHQCVMVCSADPSVETDLVEADGAWVVADSTSIEDRLEDLLRHPEALLAQALRGQEWVRRFASQSATGARLRRTLDELLLDANPPPPLTPSAPEDDTTPETMDPWQ